MVNVEATSFDVLHGELGGDHLVLLALVERQVVHERPVGYDNACGVGGRGDQKVIVNIEIPKKLDDNQRKLFEQLAETLGSEVLPQEKSIFVV